jgi:hypothetical protein
LTDAAIIAVVQLAAAGIGVFALQRLKQT